ncbi:MAG: hypothetical protein ACTHK0_10955 [Ginsengibacter sp.]
MKTILIMAAMLLGVSACASVSTNDTAMKKFKENFPEAQSIKWYNGSDYYEVSFIDKNIPERIYYDQDGNVYRTIRYYDETKLNPFIAQKIKERYGNKSIKCVTEMQEESGTLYQIILQDKKHLYVVNCNESGDMYLQHRYIKG